MNERRTKLGGRPPRLGFLVDWLEDTYQATVLRGAFDAARARGASLVCFAGGVLDAPHRSGAQRNHIYDLVGRESVDAVIVLSGAIGNYVDSAVLTAFCRRFRGLPVCSIATEIAGTTSVLVDNATGMRKAITHLLRVHSLKRIAFVRGPAANAEAERRFEIYRTVLAEHGLPFDPQLVADGDFQPQGGRDAVTLLFDERRLGPEGIDAIVAANDAMALGILAALDERRIRVPEQVALVGFDDIEDVRYCTPPLTSVRQPLYEQGKEAVRLVMAELQGRSEVSPVVLHTDLISRRSCKCFEQGARASWAPVPATTRNSFEAAIVERRQVILAELSRAARGSFSAAGSGWELRLLNAFAAQLRGDSTDSFAVALDDVLHRVQQSGGDVTVCHDVISAMRRQMLGCLSVESDRRSRAEDMFQEVRSMTGDSIARAQARERLRVERWARTLSETGAGLLATFDIEHLGQAVERGFPKLGIGCAALVLYDVHPGQARLAFAYESGRLLDVPPDRRQFSAEIVVPQELRRREHGSYAVLPLFFKQERLGYLLVELGIEEGFAYEALRELFSAAIKGARLVHEVTQAREEHALMAEALESHAGDFTRLHRNLDELKTKVATVAPELEADVTSTHAEFTEVLDRLRRVAPEG